MSIGVRVPPLAVLVLLPALVAGCAAEDEVEAARGSAGSIPPAPRLIERTVVLPTLHLEGLEEGMHGPDTVVRTVLTEGSESGRVWLKRFRARLIDEATGESGEDYFCHVHLLPDGFDESYESRRIVGVHAGGSGFELPEGFALPVEAGPDAPLHLYGMSADYGRKGEPADVHYEVDLAYYAEAEAQAAGIRPLDLRFVRLMRPKSEVSDGDAGGHGGHGEGHGGANAGHGGAHAGHGGADAGHGGAHAGHGGAHAGHGGAHGGAAPASGHLGGLRAGHEGTDMSRWHFMVPPGRHEFRSPLRPWRVEGKGRRVHQVHFHTHPYAEYGEIHDKTAGRTLWRAASRTDRQKGIVAEVEQYSDPLGFWMPADHEYELVMAVDNPTDAPIDAMLTARIFFVEE